MSYVIYKWHMEVWTMMFLIRGMNDAAWAVWPKGLQAAQLFWSPPIMRLRFFLEKQEKRKKSSMIHSVRPTVSLVVNIVFTWNLLCFARFWKVCGDGRTTCVKRMITIGRDCGSAEWIKRQNADCIRKRNGREKSLKPQYFFLFFFQVVHLFSAPK